MEKYPFPKKLVFYAFLILAALFSFSVCYDRYFIKAANSVWRNAFLDRIFLVFEYPGNFLFLSGVFIAALSGALWKRFRVLRIIALAAIASYILTSYSVDLLKGNIYRPRPFEEMHNLGLHRLTSVKMTGDSFPSGHAAGAFALLFPFILFMRKFLGRAFLLAAGALMVYSRVYLGAHFLSDAVAGAALGAAIATLCYFLIARRSKKIGTPLPEIPLWILLFFSAAIIMHRPLSLVHPVTGESLASGYSLDYSAARLFFEPYLGLAAYFNLSGNIATQQFSWLLWGCAVSFVLIFLKGRFKRGKLSKKAVVFVAVIAAMVIVQFSFFSGRLPAYKLISKKKNHFIIDLHSHTNASYPWQWDVRTMVNQHTRSGFQGSFLTDYNTAGNAVYGKKIIEEEKNNFLLMPGQEYKGEKIHLLLLGQIEDIPAAKYNPEEAISRAHALGGVVIVAHYWSGTYKHYSLLDLVNMGVDGFEIANRSELREHYQKNLVRDIYNLSMSKGLLMSGGTDNHGLHSATYVWNAFNLDGKDGISQDAAQTQIMDILRGRRQERMKVITLYSGEYAGWARIIFDPPFSLFYYFRGLNFLQWLSWAGWGAFFYLLINFKRCFRKDII